MTSFDLLQELAVALDRLVPQQDVTPDWNDVVGRTAKRRRRRTIPLKLALAIAVALLLLAGVATATYLLLHHASATQPRPGVLTVTAGGYNARWPVEIVEPQPTGKVVVIWRCPAHAGCGEPAGLAWSADGVHVAFTLWAFNAKSPYQGLHILNLQTGRDVHPRLHNCEPATVAWAPDNRTLAYDCAAFSPRTSQIHLIDSDGARDRVLSTLGRGANAPTWAPDGTRIAFARHGAIYAVTLAGGAQRLLARDGYAPAWSPDGQLIAYRAPTALRLMTPRGRPVRTAAGALAFGPGGIPAWSPDGRRLAITTSSNGRLYLVDATGRNLHRLPFPASAGSLGQPAFYPLARRTQTAATTPGCGGC